jgi:outer membrane protein
VRRHQFVLGLSICIGVCIACSAAAEQAAEQTEPNVFVGLGVLDISRPYVGVSDRIYPVPLFGYEGPRLYLRGLSGGYRLIRGEGWSIGPVFQPRFEGYESGDSSKLKGMRDRDGTLDAGLGFSWHSKWGLISASWLTDVFGKHNGHETELSYTLKFPWNGFEWVPSVGLRYKSANLTSYYYGVRADEARVGRPAYKPGSAVDPFVRLAVTRRLNEKWSLVGGVQYEWLDSEIHDSPIVEQRYFVLSVLGLMYTF